VDLIMAMQVKYADIVVGKATTRYTIGDSFVEDIKMDLEAMSIIVFMKDGSVKHHFGCPCVVTSEDGPEIIAPKIEIAS